MPLQVYRNGQPQALLTIDENTVFVQKLMGEHKIIVDTVAAAPLAIQIGDYITFEGESFYLNTMPHVEKQNNITYKYAIVFEGSIYALYNKLFLDEGSADFAYHGTPNDLLLLLLTNINSIQPGWVLTEVDAAESQTLSFSGDSCRTALTKIAEAFKMEYKVIGQNIYLKESVGVQTTLNFEYGRGKGLYTIERNSIDRNNLVTRAFGFGSRKNLDINYRNGVTRLVFEELTLENNIGLYGIREGSVTFEDIYPARTGTVTQIDAGDSLVIFDNTLDFDINDQLIEGTVGKIVFKSGHLSGYEFEIKRYLNGTKKIEFLSFAEENGYELPNNNFKPVVGDEYTLVDIAMPQTYIDAAELLLKQQTQAYLDENSIPRVVYGVTIDEKYIRDQGIELKAGDFVSVLDTPLGIDNGIQVTEVSYPVLFPDRVAATIADSLTYTIQERLIAETVNNRVITRTTDLKRAALSRKTASRFREMQDLVFDPDGYFDGTRIKPNSVETLMLSVGAKSQNFGLNGVSISPNHGGNANAMNISNGQLVHYEIEIDGLGYVWAMDPATFNTLISGTSYYVYARCSKTSLTGTWHISPAPKETEADAGQYLFYMGILYAVADGRRDFEFTKGMTYIAGDTITTGTIKSLDGLNFFNLTEGKFMIGDANSSLDWNVTTPDKLTIKGSILQTAAGETIYLPNDRGDWNVATTYLKGDTVTYLGSVYIKISETPSVGQLPTDVTRWRLYVSKGTDGQDGPAIVYRGEYPATGGITLYNNALRRDVVKHNGTYHIYQYTDDFWNDFFIANRFEDFGAQFESVATNLLLAENANIADWIIKSGQIVSQSETNGTPRALLDGNNGKIILTTSKDIYDEDNAAETIEHIVELDSVSGRLKCTHSLTSSQPYGRTEVDSEGIVVTFAGRNAGAGEDKKKVGVLARVEAKLKLSGSAEDSAVIGVYGSAENKSSVALSTPTYGGYFKELLAQGLYVKTKTVSSSSSLDRYDVFVYVIGVANYITYLPVTKAGQNGRVILFWAKDVKTVNGNGLMIEQAHTQLSGASITLNDEMGLFVLHGGVWRYSRLD